MDPKPSLLVLTNFYMQNDGYWIEISNILQLYIEKNKEISLIGRFYIFWDFLSLFNKAWEGLKWPT